MTFHRFIVFVLIVFTVLPAKLLAWSEGGHHLIAAVAFSLLSHKEKTELLRILKQHPRFAEDFVPPENLPNEEEKTRWLVGRSGYCADVARGLPQERGSDRSNTCYRSGV
jgi:hypothetical protein